MRLWLSIILSAVLGTLGLRAESRHPAVARIGDLYGTRVFYGWAEPGRPVQSFGTNQDPHWPTFLGEVLVVRVCAVDYKSALAYLRPWDRERMRKLKEGVM